jgi:hypothetical protein
MWMFKALFLTLIGALIGAALVRAFMLDTLEEMGFRMFWQTLREVRVDAINWGAVVTSATFMKIGFGALVGGGVGAWYGTGDRD